MYVLLQTGDEMWVRDAIHPAYLRDFTTNVYNTNAKIFLNKPKGGTVSDTYIW